MNLNNHILFVRADASDVIGIGHIMRNIPLAQSWKKEGGEVFFISNQLPNNLERRLKNENFDVIYLKSCLPGSAIDALQTVQMAQKKHANFLIIDGYYFKSAYQKIIKEHHLKLLFMDDFGHLDHYYADIVLNRSLISKQISYSNKEPYTKLLLGSKYNAIREEFVKYGDHIPIIRDDIKEVLITFGGADPQNITLKMIEVLNRVFNKDVKVHFIIGATYKHDIELNKIMHSVKYDFKIHRDVSNMADFMHSADIAVTAGGTTLFEMAYMGLPSIVMSTASNQKSSKVFADKYNTCLYLGNALNVGEQLIISNIEKLKSKELRSKMSVNGQRLIDGKGNERLLQEIIKIK
ncbi:UDP-2,4-diacetamido-2,4,6-trideoxy-beta-L-altropyranose hydrolase [Gracilibacillus phocaeensis]|uniref:UDP-2,4-diacetamido-2,4, 6-trideoxy-beta-L-altropyranose hydrolase n=1 Tax=Gracilibacillus phocaeensis TaxID=2042304 RepID=UPI001031901B|nr:UDP-2,4-diacetamido-2,4,6-trideoxy-beta-L-altropyranose hydrolase [Gracilibacillus phocaeensis]